MSRSLTPMVGRSISNGKCAAYTSLPIVVVQPADSLIRKQHARDQYEKRCRTAPGKTQKPGSATATPAALVTGQGTGLGCLWRDAGSDARLEFGNRM